MGTINKGTIATVNHDENTATVQTLSGIVTNDLVVPWHLRKDSGKLEKGMEVIYVEFEDQTGLILSRADGDWCYHFIKSITIDGDAMADDISLKNHTHPYTWTDGAGNNNTSKPQ